MKTYKEVAEVLFYLLAELILAYIFVAKLKIDPRVLPIVGMVFIYLGKIIIKKVK